jgi:hypothetical protein
MPTTGVQVALLSSGALVVGAASYVLVRSRRLSPEERERKRRLHINSVGRLIEGVVKEVKGATVFYGYSWRGIEYDCSQDLSAMATMLPPEVGSLVGPVTVKFAPQNPYNSIVLCESWSGFPLLKPIQRKQGA